MKLIYQNKTNRGQIDDEALAKKPQFSFPYEYINVTDTVAEYAPRDRANYLDIEPTKEEITQFYENRPLSDVQFQEVMSFYSSYPREPDTKPTYDSATQKLVENGTEVVDGLTYKKYEVQPKTQTELEDYLESTAKPIKILELKNQRDKTIAAPINQVKVSSVEDRENVQGSIDLMVANSISEIGWVVENVQTGQDEVIQLTVADLENIRDMYVLRKMQTFDKYGQLLTAINSATTIEEIESIVW